MDSLKCPITCEIFTDPVTAADGHTYERDAITSWLKHNPTSPVTREPMTISSLRPNYVVKKMLEEFQSSMVKKHYHFELNIDIRKTKNRPLFQAPGKTIYEAEWISRTGPSIVLLRIDGAKARREAEFYVQLGCHPHIVRTYGMLESEPNTLTLVQEFASEGDLSELLREKRFRPSPAVLLEIFIQIADAMVCLADNNIVHGDLACRNVLVFRMDNLKSEGNLVKLTDFGLTRASTLYTVAESSASATMIIIPVRYAAPEILQNDTMSSYTEKSDVYSMGVLMWEAYSSGQIPYALIDNDSEVRRLKLQGHILSRPENCDQTLWNIITNCWQQQSTARPTFKILKQSLLDLQFQQRFSMMNKTNSEQPCTKDSTRTSAATSSYQSHFENSSRQSNITNTVPSMFNLSIQSQSRCSKYQNEPIDDDYDDDNDDEEEVELSFHQQAEYCEHNTDNYDENESEEEPSFQFTSNYYNHENTYVDDYENEHEEEDGPSFQLESNYYDHENTDEDNDENEEEESSFQLESNYYNHETTDEDDENESEEEPSFQFTSNHYNHENTDEDDDGNENKEQDEDEEVPSFQFESNYYNHESTDENDYENESDREEEEPVYQFTPNYYNHESTDDDDDDDDDRGNAKGFSFQIQTQEFYYVIRN